MICQLCKEKKDNEHLDNTVEHLLITMKIDGVVHIHGPFGNEYVMRKMADALIAEMDKSGIHYTPPIQHTPGN
jgi:hypothetical protein